MKEHTRITRGSQLPGLAAFTAGVLVCLSVSFAAFAQDAPVSTPSTFGADATAPAAPATPPDAGGPPVDVNTFATPGVNAAPSPAPGAGMFRAGVAPSDEAPVPAATTTPAPPLILPSNAQFASPFQFVQTGAGGLLRGSGIHGGVSAGVSYDDNIFLGNGHNTARVASASYFVSPFITFKRGGEDAFEQGSENSIAVTYSGSLNIYDESHVAPEYNSSVSLVGQLVLKKITLGIGEQTNIFSDALVGSSQRTQYRFFNTDFSARIPWTDKLTSFHDFIIAIASYDTGYDSYDISSRNTLSRTITDKLSLGIGFGIGATFIEDSPSQPYQQVSISATYSNLRKLSASLSVGGQVNELPDGSNLGLVFSGSISDRIFDGTSLNLQIYRNVNNSAETFATTGVNNPVQGRFNADYTATGIALSVSQRVLSRFSLSGNGGFEYSDYFSATDGSSLNQHFDYLYLGVSIGTSLTRYASMQASYNFRQNTGRTESTSNPNIFTFDDSVFSASVTIQF